MFLQPAGFIRLRHGRYSEGFAKRDQDAIKALYRDNGFRDVQGHDRRPWTTTRARRAMWRSRSTIEEGPQYLVADLKVNGHHAARTATRLSRCSPASPGQPFSETSVAIDRDYILTIYQSTGYPDVTFDYQVLPGDGEHADEGRLQRDPRGSRAIVRDVLITGMHTHPPAPGGSQHPAEAGRSALLDRDGPHAAAPLQPGRLRQGGHGDSESRRARRRTSTCSTT